MGFVHLHCHSYFSFYDGTAPVGELVNRAQELGMTALALTDYNGVYGAVQFIQKAREVGIKPIIGAEIEVKKIGKVVLLARSREGYRNLCRILSVTMMKDPYHPLVLPETLALYFKDLFALVGTPLADSLEKSDREGTERMVDFSLEIFGPDGLVIELQNHGLAGDHERMSLLHDLARKRGLLSVATNNVHLLTPDDYFVHQALIRAARIVHHREVFTRPNSAYYLKSGTQMARLFQGYGEALLNTELIAQECNLEISLNSARPPRWEMPDDMPASDYLSRLCYSSLNRLSPKERTAAARRLAVELSIIEKKGFSDYFLVVADLVRFAKENGIRHSCRGSAAGSLTAYLLGISTVDPLEHGLLFERFLNPERTDTPDIDIDFDSRRRDEVIDYAMKRYESHAAMVATISRFRGRSAVREIGRSMGLPYEKIDELVRSFRYMPASRIREALVSLPELRDSELRSETYKELLDVCALIDNFPRHVSVHLGGVVIAKEPIEQYSPVQRSRKGWPVLSFDKEDVETLGWIKTDLLGLRMLSAVEEAEKLIRIQGKEVSLDAPDLNDPEIYDLLRSTDTLGCFQVESPGMRSLLGQLKPGKFHDIVCAISLFRPGPVQADMVGPFIARKTGREKYVIPHKKLLPILRETYGVVLFQEQVLRIANAIAGMTLGKGDLMRRAMKEPKSEKMKILEEEFVAGATHQGIDMGTAQEVFRNLSTLAAFGFNKAHACSFAKIVLQSVLLKHYFPAEFMIGVLNNLPGMYSERVLLHDARRFGVPIFPPHINRSAAGYALEGEGIRVGLKGVRHMGPANLGKILEERAKGPFEDFDDFRRRVKVIEPLLRSMVLAGLFDSVSPTRKGLIRILDEEKIKITEKAKAPEEFSLTEKVRYELSHLGLDLSAHILSLYRERLNPLRVLTCKELRGCVDGQQVAVAGVKILLHTPPTRSGIRVVFISIEDETGVADVAVFPDAQELYGPTLFTSQALLIHGKVTRMGETISLTAERIHNLEEALADRSRISVA